MLDVEETIPDSWSSTSSETVSSVLGEPHADCDVQPLDPGSTSSESSSPEAPSATDTSSSVPPNELSTRPTEAEESTTTAPEPACSTSPPPPVPTPAPPERATVEHTILISVDGLASRYLDEAIAAGNAPFFEYLQQHAAWTHNARTDKTYTITLPNHTCMLTGLPVWSAPGFEPFRAHFYTANSDPLADEVLHSRRVPARSYTPSVFDVVHDHGLTTALFASKTKFSLYANSYNDAGRQDEVGADNGTKKIDRVVIDTSSLQLVDALENALLTDPANFTFVHLHDTDSVGHSLGWGSPEYLAALADVDALLARVLAAIDSGPLTNRTALIVTTDHGGVGTGHFDAEDPLVFQIPFYVMAPGVTPGDAYLSFENRFDPGSVNPEYREPRQPVRNGDSGNLALYLMGLPPIPESIIHSAELIVNF